jgi:hypothetical protein
MPGQNRHKHPSVRVAKVISISKGKFLTQLNGKRRREDIFSLDNYFEELRWWGLTGSNRRPSACKADALAN